MQENKQTDDPILVLARQFVELKTPFADNGLKETMADEVRRAIDKTIRLELVSVMNPSQIADYETMLEKGDATDNIILAFIEKCGININEVTQRALTRFRIAYLGA